MTELRDFDSLPRQFARPEDDAVLVGLGSRQPGLGDGLFDARAGAAFAWPLATHAKGAYHHTQPFLERGLLRLNETVFWRDGEGFGTTTCIDLERPLAVNFLVCWTVLGTYSEGTEGVRWFSNLTLYRTLGDGRARTWPSSPRGEPRGGVAIEMQFGRG